MQEKYKKAGCIFWKGYLNEYFTRADLCLLKDILQYSIETKRQLKNERSMMKKKPLRPKGMPDLTGSFARVIDEAWEHQIAEPNLNMDVELGEQVSEEELLQNALAVEAIKMFEDKKLNTESVQTMMDPKGHMTCEAAEYFCKLLDEQYPESKFIHLNQYLSRKERRELHALEINVKQFKNLHFIFNRNPKQLFDNEQLAGHHWAVATIRMNGDVYLGDGLYKNIPANLKIALNDYYQIKFGKSLEKIINLSGRKHFPKQNDGNLCGFIGLMNMTLFDNESLLEFFNSKVNFREVKKDSFLIFNPSTYNLYLRQIFMRAYAVSELRLDVFISEVGFASIRQLVGKEKEPLNPEGFQDKFKLPGKSASASSRSGKLPTQEKDLCSRNRYQVFSEDENRDSGKDVIEEDLDNQKKTTEDGNEAVPEFIQSDFTGKIVLKKSNCNDRTNHKVNYKNFDYKIDSDGFKWKRKRVNGRTKRLLYVCAAVKDGIACSAAKTIYTPYGSFFKGERIVEYLSVHSFCQPEQSVGMNKQKDRATKSDPKPPVKGKPKNISEENLGDAAEVNTDENKSKDNSMDFKDKNIEVEEILENSFNGSFDKCTENDNIEDNDYERQKLVDPPYHKENAVAEDVEVTEPEKSQEYVEFLVNRKCMKLKKYYLQQQPPMKYYVESSCAVLIDGFEGKNLDSHTWTDFHGGHGNGRGITTMRCKESQACKLKKKKWCCLGTCPGKRFCCQFFTKIAIQVCVYIGSHDHKISTANCLSLENALNEKLEFEGTDTGFEAGASMSESKESSDDELSSFESSGEDPLNSSIEEESSKVKPNLSKYEEKIHQRCVEFFQGKEVIHARQNEIEANSEKIYIMKMGDHEKISSIAKDGYIYESNTTRKKMPPILDSQALAYSYQCQGKLVCRNSECPVLNRLTVMNSFPMKKSSSRKCRFCTSTLEKEECDGLKYILRSKENETNHKRSKYIVIKYEENHSCGRPEPVLDQLVVEELRTLFENNPELTPSHAYKSLLDKKIREKKSYKEILNVVHAFTYDHKAKNIKAGVKRGMNPSGPELSCILELQSFLSEMPELEVILKVYTDSFICASCDSYKVTTLIEHELNNLCEECKIEMQHTGPMILLTSLEQVKSAEQMTKADGAFQYSSLFLDHQNSRIINYNSFNTYLYDFHVQSITNIFTVHSIFEDQYSVCLSFKLFDEVYKSTLDTEVSFKPHGFSSDNAGAICAGIQKQFGKDVLHRTCSFHYLFGAYNHCSNALGQRASQVRYLRFAFKLLEAPTPNQFELLYKFFKTWIEKSKSRQKKIGPWLKFWYDRKVQWATAYTSLSIDAVNLAEAGQSKYKKTNKMKRLKLYQGCVYVIGDSLLYSSRLKAMASNNFVGNGPCKEILDLRESR